MAVKDSASAIVNKKVKLNWKYFAIGMAAFIPTLILFAVFVSGNEIPPKWFNWSMFAVFVPSILWSLFTAQKLELTGAYGETILLLIPTFVWLLPGHNHAILIMIIIAFIMIVVSYIMHSIALSIRWRKKYNGPIIRNIGQILVRFSFVLMSVVSTLIVSILLINWGDHGLNLVKPDASGAKDYTTSAWIIFIAAVTILVALGLVSLGLASQFNFYFKRQNKKTFGESIRMKRSLNKKSNFKRVTMIRIKKHRWWRRRYRRRK